MPNALASVWRGCGGSTANSPHADLKLHVGLEVLNGALVGLSLHDGRVHDRATPLSHAALPPGALHLADLGYWSDDS